MRYARSDTKGGVRYARRGGVVTSEFHKVEVCGEASMAACAHREVVAGVGERV